MKVTLLLLLVIVAVSSQTVSINNVIQTVGYSGSTPFTFNITLSTPATASLSLTYATVDGTAVAGTDYIGSSGTITFNSGDSVKVLAVTVNGTPLYAATKTFNLTIYSAGKLVAVGIATILNPNAPPSLSIANGFVTVGTAGNSSLIFTVTLSATSGSTTLVSYATSNGTALAGVDFAATTGILAFPPGKTFENIIVAVFGTTLYEATKMFTITLSSPVNALINLGTATGTINNPNPQPGLSINDVNATTNGTQTMVFPFNVTLSAVSGAATSVIYTTTDGTATAPLDYSIASGILNIPAGQIWAGININVNGRTLYGPARVFSVILSAPTNAILVKAIGTGTIQNNNPKPFLSVANTTASVLLNPTNITFFVTLSPASALDTTCTFSTVDGTALAGTDYVATTGTLLIKAGATFFRIYVQVNGSPVQAIKSFSLVLSAPQNAALSTSVGYATVSWTYAQPTSATSTSAVVISSTDTNPIYSSDSFQTGIFLFPLILLLAVLL